MNIRFLCVFIFLMCALAAGIADARTLHVGNKTFALSQTKHTTPSLVFGIGNEVWYGTLTISPLTDTLHIKHDNKTYSLCEPFTDTENYTYDENGRLIGANENLYLQSTGTQYIDTEYIPSTQGYKIETELVITQKSSTFGFFGYNYLDNGGKRRRQSLSGSSRNVMVFGFGDVTDQYKDIRWLNIDVAYNLVADYRQGYLRANGTYLATNAIPQSNRGNPISVFLMGTNSDNSTTSYMKLYLAKLWDETDLLVRHFVPVPACMRIGDFVVPENGMWDIVEQKFYGNSGSGSFIYGKDE